MAYVELGLEVKAAVSENKGVRAMNKETLTVIWGGSNKYQRNLIVYGFFLSLALSK